MMTMNNNEKAATATFAAVGTTESADEKDWLLKSASIGLYGRDKEYKTLLEARQRVMDNTTTKGSVIGTSSPPELICITGNSGVGKSFLVQQTIAPPCSSSSSSSSCNNNNNNNNNIRRRRSYYYGSCKFDAQRSHQPYYGIQNAFTEVCNQIMVTQDEPTFIAFLMQECLEGNDSILIEVVPMLETALLQHNIPTTQSSSSSSLSSLEVKNNAHKNDDSSAFSKDDSGEVSNRFHHVIRNFVKMICQMKPMILSLDDLQHADNASLDLIQSLLSDDVDGTIENLLIVTTALKIHNNTSDAGDGDGDDSTTSRISKWYQDLQQSKTITSPMTILELGNFEHQDIVQLVSNMFEISKSSKSELDAIELADILYQTTDGNPHFLVRLIELWITDNLIQYKQHNIEDDDSGGGGDGVGGQWDWNIKTIQQTDIPSNLEDLIVNNFQIQHEDIITLIKVASMLGTYFDDYTLSLILRSEKCGSLLGTAATSSSNHDSLSSFGGCSFYSSIKSTIHEAIAKGARYARYYRY